MTPRYVVRPDNDKWLIWDTKASAPYSTEHFLTLSGAVLHCQFVNAVHDRLCAEADRIEALDRKNWLG